MTTKHTPGKWIVGNRNGYNPCCITALIDDNMLNDRVVAEVIGMRLHCSINDIEDSEVLSNANLMAAAPDMLAELERLRIVFGWEDNHPALKIIAKAKGEV